MALSSTKTLSLPPIYTMLAIALLAKTLWMHVWGQNYACAANGCCSRYGYCGTSDTYCGNDYRNGRCYVQIANQAGGGYLERGFYTGAVFLEAACAYPRFGTTGSADDSKRKIAALFAHVTHEIGHKFCF
ncbi:Endochitinase A [Sesamum alatum]|uniref:Endochitinase A n=1 Tax=Sesamum alatum TaxID=300844 RepID=A0AAE1Y7H3_9LAMI|nr:Endochitinase A [Sesamum alatum]